MELTVMKRTLTELVGMAETYQNRLTMIDLKMQYICLPLSLPGGDRSQGQGSFPCCMSMKGSIEGSAFLPPSCSAFIVQSRSLSMHSPTPSVSAAADAAVMTFGVAAAEVLSRKHTEKRSACTTCVNHISEAHTVPIQCTYLQNGSFVLIISLFATSCMCADAQWYSENGQL